MRSALASFAVLLLLILPLPAAAATFGAGEVYSLPAGESLMDDLYAAGGTVSVSGAVRGDVLTAGGSVSVSGAVEHDLMAAGGNVSLLGSVGDDARVAGGQVVVAGQVNDDLFVAGGVVHLLPGSRIGGDLVIGGGQVVLEGEVVGNVRIAGGAVTVNGIVAGALEAEVDETISVGPAARIGGAFTYRGPEDAAVAAEATLGGAVTRLPSRARGAEKTDVSAVAGVFAGIGLLSFLLKLLGTLGTALVAVWLMRPGTQKLVADTAAAFWPTMLRGFATAILLPIGALVLVLTVVFSPIGGMLLAAFGLLVIAAKILSGILFGSWLAMVFRKQKKPTVTLGSAAVGTVLLAVLGLVPIVGWAFALVFWLAAFGALALWARDLIAPALSR